MKCSMVASLRLMYPKNYITIFCQAQTFCTTFVVLLLFLVKPRLSPPLGRLLFRAVLVCPSCSPCLIVNVINPIHDLWDFARRQKGFHVTGGTSVPCPPKRSQIGKSRLYPTKTDIFARPQPFFCEEMGRFSPKAAFFSQNRRFCGVEARGDGSGRRKAETKRERKAQGRARRA